MRLRDLNEIPNTGNEASLMVCGNTVAAFNHRHCLVHAVLDRLDFDGANPGFCHFFEAIFPNPNGSLFTHKFLKATFQTDPVMRQVEREHL